MVEKSVMTKSGKSTRGKKQAPPTTQIQPVAVHAQPVASQRIFDAVPLGIISVDWDGHIQYMNQPAKSLLGEPAQGLRLEDWPEYFGFYLDDGVVPFPAERLPLLRALRGEAVDDAEEMILRKEAGKPIWISMSAELLRDENGNVEGAIATIRDIHYRKQIEISRERQIKRTEALYRFSHG